MGATVNLQSTINWAAPLIRFTPQLTGSLEPALTNANLVKQTILGTPFIWRQNRATVQIPITAAAQDYPVALADFGFLESASVVGATASFEIEIDTLLGISGDQARPGSVTVQSDDNGGNLVFRYNTVPDQAYVCTLVYQRKPVPMTSLASLWAPLPDELAYVYNFGYLALAAMMADDARFPVFNQRFVSHLLGAQEGISDLARNIFLANWTAVQAQAQRSQGQVAQNVQARGAL